MPNHQKISVKLQVTMLNLNKGNKTKKDVDVNANFVLMVIQEKLDCDEK